MAAGARDAQTQVGVSPPDAHLWPDSARVDAAGRLVVAGRDLAGLAEEYGTPLYIYDVATIRAQCQAFRDAFTSRYANSTVAYASKAYLSPALCRVLAGEDVDLDAVSAGEVAVARAAGMPPARLHLHGNFKPDDELAAALDAGVGRIVADSLYELERIAVLAAARGVRARIWLRVCPDVATETHPHDQTGHANSKFGLDLASGAAEEAARVALASPHLHLVGVHAHAGSQIFDPRPAAEVTRALVRFAAHLRATYGADVTEISPGGGWGVAYHPAEQTPPIQRYAEAVTRTLREEVTRARLPEPRLIIEPGRGIVARAGVALYRAGPRKCVPGGRTFVAVDGGMGDNVRPALYGARYHAALPARISALAEETVCVVGRYCESGDVLVEAVDLPRVAPGEVLAVPVAGAYHLPMASNYNLVPRPAVVFVEGGRAWLVRRRETLADLMACEADDMPKEPRTDRSR